MIEWVPFIILSLALLFVFFWKQIIEFAAWVLVSITPEWISPPTPELNLVGTCVAYGYNPFDDTETPGTKTPNMTMSECFKYCMDEPELLKNGTYRSVLPGGVRLFTPSMNQR